MIVSLKRMIAPPTSRIVAVWPTPQSAPTVAARATDRERVTIVDTATTAAIKRGSPIDRAHRDIVTASQHLVVNDRVYGMVGRVLMGKPAGVIMI